MSDAVVDASVIGMTDEDLLAQGSEDSIRRRVKLIDDCANKKLRLRCNPTLEGEYSRILKDSNKDLHILFLGALESAFRVTKNKLDRHAYLRSLDAGWPSHDQHLLAAAIGGTRPTIYVTEKKLFSCATKVKREFSISVSSIL